MYGRGTYDMLAGIAAMIVAAADVASGPHAGDIVLALVADEEFASAGTEEVLRHGVRTDAAIICEPTEEELVIAHRGFAWFDVIVHGRAAHGSRRDLGIDAITKAGAFLVALGAHDAELAARPAHPLLGTGSVHASIISGGEEQSSYPASCTISLERRTLPGEDAASVGAELAVILDALAGSDPEFRYTLTEGLSRAAHSVDDGTPIARAVDAAHLGATGEHVTRRGEPFWTDAALLGEAGIPAVLYGPRGGGAHAATEWGGTRLAAPRPRRAAPHGARIRGWIRPAALIPPYARCPLQGLCRIAGRSRCRRSLIRGWRRPSGRVR